MAAIEKKDDVFPGKVVKGPDGRATGVVASVDAKGFEVVGLNGRRRRFSWEQLMAAARGRGGDAPPEPEPTEEIRAVRGSMGGLVAAVFKRGADGWRLDRILGDAKDVFDDQRYLPCPVCRAEHLAVMVDGSWQPACPRGVRSWTDETLARESVPMTSRPDITLASPGGPPTPPGAKSVGWTGKR